MDGMIKVICDICGLENKGKFKFEIADVFILHILNSTEVVEIPFRISIVELKSHDICNSCISGALYSKLKGYASNNLGC